MGKREDAQQNCKETAVQHRDTEDGAAWDREITTNTLVQKIAEGREFHRVMEDSRGHFTEITVSEYLTGLCTQRNLVPEQVIKKAQIDRTECLPGINCCSFP